MQDYTVEHGMIRFLQKPQSRDTVSGIATKHRAIVKYSDEQDTSPEEAKGEQRSGLGFPTVHSHFAMATGRSDQAIKLVVGDITKHRVDVMINAANEKLEHYGGVAHAFIAAG